MRRLYFIRHGQASMGAKNYDELSELGMTQARLLGEYFKANEIRFDQIICGTQVRHKQSAQHFLSGYHTKDSNLPFTYMKEFNEYNFEAIIKAYLKCHPTEKQDSYSNKALIQLLKKSLTSWSQDQLSHGKFNELDETWAQLQQRVSKGLLKLQSDFSQSDTLIFTSGGPIAQIVSQILDIPANKSIELNLTIQNTAITQCVCNQDSIRLDSFNSIPHLESPKRHTLRSFS
ncbi:histidine phosphatase family protein [Marinomonas sp. PE14-40]|uniref:histidine phosphatase family protein n=1 Tax=Marinomonas sp. PE14-40 TaxID=3060621 RepID=UPI003F66A35E